MINLKIDPEFQNQIPPLTDDEYKQLEENILKEGKLRILGFQFLRAGQLCDAVCLEISCCRPVPCQLCTVLFFKGCGAIFLVFL